MEIVSPDHARPKKHKKHRNKDDAERSEKKRKRGTEDVEIASPTKKPRSKHHETSPIAQTESIEQLDSQDESPFHQQTSSLYLPVAPISQRHVLQGLCAEHLSPLILTYYPPFHGVILSYSNAKCSTSSYDISTADGRQMAYARAVDEYAASFVWLTADFLIFRPQRGNVIEGYISLQNESSIGLVCWNFFNASIERNRLSKDWEWTSGVMSKKKSKKIRKTAKLADPTDQIGDEQEDVVPSKEGESSEGYFKDGDGRMIGGLIRFRVKNVETSRTLDRENGFLSIEGTMLSDDEEKMLQELESLKLPSIAGQRLERMGEPSMTGALMNGYDGSMEIEQLPSSKHRAKY